MSFILDALKKSEAERRQGEVPKLQNEPFSPPPRRRPLWLLLLTLALLLNGAVLGWWLPARQEKLAPVAVAAGGAGQTVVDAKAATPEPFSSSVSAPAEPVVRPAPAKTAGKEAQTRRAAPPAAAPARSMVAAATPVPDSFPPVAELPGDVRSGLPGLDLQLHFFTPAPERRLVRLNGLNLREGGRSTDGLSVVEITPDGVRLSYGGARFFLPAGRP